MQLSPKVAIWLNVILVLLTAISTGTLSFSGVVSPATATQIVAYAGVAVTVLNLVLHAYTNSTPGPLAPPDPPVVKAATVLADLPANAPLSLVQQTKAMVNDAVADHTP